MSALCWDRDDGKGTGPDIIMDDAGDMTHLLHQGYKAELLFLKDGTLPLVDEEEDNSNNNVEVRIINKILKNKLSQDNTFWSKAVKRIGGISEDTAVGIHRLNQLQQSNELLLPCINLKTAAISKIEKNYCYLHALPQALKRATEQTLCGKQVLICGFSDLGQAAATALKAAGCIVNVLTSNGEIAPSLSPYKFVTLLSAELLAEVEIILTTNNSDKVLTFELLSQQIKKNCILANLDGNYSGESDYVSALNQCTTRVCLKPHVCKYVFEDGRELVMLSEGRVLTLCHALGNTSFVKSYYFTNQILAQIELYVNKARYVNNSVYELPEVLVEKVQKLHFGAF
jgi:adenosylhomocysteinase